MNRLKPLFALVFTATLGLSCPASNMPWRSALYPEDWTPSFTDGQGRFLHDFSYAGYHNGEEPPEVVGGAVFNVVSEFGADNTGASDATTAIRNAIDAASVGGGVVYFPPGLYRCDGVLTITAPKVVLRGDGPLSSRIFFTKYEGMGYRAHITFKGDVTREADIPLVSDGMNRAFTVEVGEGNGLQPGDEISVGWVITDDFVDEHNMTGTWVTFNGKWKSFFRREITHISATKSGRFNITMDVPNRYPAKLRDRASIRRETGYLSECGMEDLGVANAVAYRDAWAQNQVHLIEFNDAKDCWVRNVHSFASPHPDAGGFHLQSCGIEIQSSKRITVMDCRMEKAQHRGGGGNGYLFEIGKSDEVLVMDCTGFYGRHNFVQNWDFGTTGLVFLRCRSRGSRNILGEMDPIGLPAYCDYHHSLAMACLVDSCELDDGWYGGNRGDYSSGAGNTVTQSVYWNTSGKGQIRSWQYGNGYIIGTTAIKIKTNMTHFSAIGTAPEDYVEGQGRGAMLVPQSLYEDQRAKRLAR